MTGRRSILIHGLGIALRRLPAFLWTWFLSLALALAFCFPLKVQLTNLLDQSLEAGRLASGFDIGTAFSAARTIHEGAAGQASTLTSHGSVPAYLLLYFLLLPGTLYCYITRTHARFSTLVRQGLLHFWRFIRITALTLLAAALILGPLMVAQRRWAAFIDDHFVGRPSLLLRLAGLLVVVLAASLIRLYFDLVEAYTVQLGAEHRPNEKPDRRVRRTLIPTFRLLRYHFFRAWIVFLLLALLGAAAAFLCARTALHMLAQPRVWPMFLVGEFGLMIMLFTRFWQRGAEVSLVQQHPLPSPLHTHSIPFAAKPVVTTPAAPAEYAAAQTYDPIPDPEPAPPSLDEPDPGVFHHDPQKPEH